MGEDEFDFGSLFGGGDSVDMSNFDLGSLDLGSLADLGSLSDLGNFDVSNLDLGNLDLGNLSDQGVDLSSLLNSLQADQTSGQNLDLQSLLQDIGGGNVDQTSGQNLDLQSLLQGSGGGGDVIQNNFGNPFTEEETARLSGQNSGAYLPGESVVANKDATNVYDQEDMEAGAGNASNSDISALEALMGSDLSKPDEADISNLGMGDLAENAGGAYDQDYDTQNAEIQKLLGLHPKPPEDTIDREMTSLQNRYGTAPTPEEDREMTSLQNRYGTSSTPEEDREMTSLQNRYGTSSTPKAERELASLYKPQDLGISQKNIDEAQAVFAQNKTPSGYQKVGSDLINVRDDGTANAINTETGESYSLTADQVAKMDKQGLLESKTSGYVAATGGKGFVPGGGKTIENADGTKTVITTDGKVLTTNKDGTIVDTGKKVDVNNSALDTIKDTVTKNTDDVVKKLADAAKTAATTTKTGTASTSGSGNNMSQLMMLLALMAMMNKGGGGSGSSGATIPSLSADRKQLPYGGGATNYRPGQGGVNYFTPTTYTTKAAGGGLMSLNAGGHLGGYSDGGRLLRGPGDGVSDSIPATIGGKQPARLATGEFVVPARIVSELGNGSTDSGAQRLYEMMDRVQHARRKTKNVAANTKAAKYLPA
jgi:hypothetical protein